MLGSWGKCKVALSLGRESTGMDLCIQFVNIFFKLIKVDQSLPLILIV